MTPTTTPSNPASVPTAPAAAEVAALLAEAKPFAIALAREAGGILRSYQERGFDIVHKGTVDLVTDADKASETLIASRIRERFPQHRLLGEEGSRGATDPDAPFGWVIDPLDGTTNFAHHYPQFAVSLGLELRGDPVLGVVYDPSRDEVFVGVKGGGATLNDQPIHVSGTESVRQALMATGFSYDLTQRTESTALWTAFNNAGQGLRRDGAAALDLCWVACGRLDGYFERPVMPWDMCGAVVIVREAGGIVTALEDDAWKLERNEALAAGPQLIPEMKALIAATLAEARSGH
ncbi:MAG: inositol monophosphatase family protein [Thermomicrobiales bacterium]